MDKKQQEALNRKRSNETLKQEDLLFLLTVPDMLWQQTSLI